MKRPTPAEWAANPEAALVRAEEDRASEAFEARALQALQNLPKRERAVAFRRWMLEQSEAEVATDMRLTRAKVRATEERARRILREALR